MSDLVAFLTARLDEDEQLDWHVLDCSAMPRGEDMDQPCCEAQARIPREVEAGRRLLGAYDTAVNGPAADLGVADALEAEIKSRAAVYSDHPDYAAATAE